MMDVHTGPTAEEAWDFFFYFLDEAERMGKTIVIEGGWAVAAHGSPIPSVDLDVLFSNAELEGDHDYYDLVHSEGTFARPGHPSLLDAHGIEDPNEAWATNKGYRRSELLEGRTETIRVTAPDGRNRTIKVPTLPALLVMKLKAFRDRETQHRIMKEPAQRASDDHHELEQVSTDANHRLRKVAKDLVDIVYLWEKATPEQREDAVAFLRKHGLHNVVRESLKRIHDDALAAAAYVVEQHKLALDLGATRANVERALRRK